MRTFLAIFARFCRDMNVVRHRVAQKDVSCTARTFRFCKKAKNIFSKNY